MIRGELGRPLVGIGIMIFKDNKVLMGRRKGSHGSGEFSFPGGHLEYMESFEACVRRETLEECGVSLKNIRFQLVANVAKYTPKHYVHIGLIADWADGEPRVLEPEKCESWAWYNLDNLPEPVFEMAKIMLDNYGKPYCYFDLR